MRFRERDGTVGTPNVRAPLPGRIGQMQNTTQPEELDCDGLTLWRGDRCLFDDLSFQIGAGAAAVVRGPNGSGKTSLLRVVCVLSPPEHG